MAKQDKFYFENLKQAADCACNTAKYLVECLTDFDVKNIQDMLETMHAFETEGDHKKHEMSAALAKAFVTPLDREDIALLSNNIDDVSDCVEDVLQTIYVNCITAIPEEILTFAKLIHRSCQTMRAMLGEFENFKKPAKLHDMVIKLSDLEEEGDRLYLQYKHNILKNCTDVLEVISWREILDKMETCLDTCEHVGDCVDTVVMKNS